MSVVLFRVDERLIHGQVVVGWGSQLHPHRMVVVDDDLAGSEWEQELYQVGLPPGLASDFVTVERGRDAVPGWQSSRERVIVLTRDLGTMVRLARSGLLRDCEINIGGIHHAPGRRQVLPYVYLSAAEELELLELASEGAVVTARDLPNARGVTVAQMLEEAHR
jgi:PTS system mannose-specific IIB component/fructoselysine and glucoselysine-specific PTS system IIB component